MSELPEIACTNENHWSGETVILFPIEEIEDGDITYIRTDKAKQEKIELLDKLYIEVQEGPNLGIDKWNFVKDVINQLKKELDNE